MYVFIHSVIILGLALDACSSRAVGGRQAADSRQQAAACLLSVKRS